MGHFAADIDQTGSGISKPGNPRSASPAAEAARLVQLGELSACEVAEIWSGALMFPKQRAALWEAIEQAQRAE
jgi:hypothetical protein